MSFSFDQLASMLATAAISIFAYLMKSYIASIRKDIGRVEKDVATLAGHLGSIQSDLRANTTEMAKTSSELRAIWRFIDAPKRATDID